jgi:hypothetical protein
MSSTPTAEEEGIEEAFGPTFGVVCLFGGVISTRFGIVLGATAHVFVEQPCFFGPRPQVSALAYTPAA